jgi:hypothetical protein
MRTHLIHRPMRHIIPPLGDSTTRWNSCLPSLYLILHGGHAAVTACSLVQRNSVPSTQMRCMITANRRAGATIAFFISQCLPASQFASTVASESVAKLLPCA